MGSKASRNTSIEALRLIAVAGIAIFHTFQWTFQAVCAGLPEYAPLAVFPYSGALGFINLLGCWANEVFFMISGYFLIPSAVRALQNGSSAQSLTLKSLDRLKKIVLPTLFYCATCLFVSMYVYPLPEISLHEIGWLTLGIEFIWVYAASVLLVPVIAVIRQQIGSKRAPFVVALLVLATFGINCYIAATANEAAGIILWRKLMSAITYLVSFIAAGECPRMPRQRIRRSKIQDHTHRTRCRRHSARASAIGKQPVRRALEALLQVHFRHILYLGRRIRCRRSTPSAVPQSHSCRQDNHISRRRNARFLRRAVVYLQRLATHLRQCNLHHGNRHPNGNAPSSRRHFARNPYEPLPRAFPAPRGYRAQSRSRVHQGPYERLSDLLTPQTTKRAYARNK